MSPEEIAALFAAGGALSTALPGFTPRVAQQTMALGVASAIESGENYIVEAGTGTGKTFAYLVPALLSDQRLVISTGTKTLQDQLYLRDLPRVAAALGARRRVSLLKGRANYLCLHRIDKARQDVRARAWWPRLAEVAAFAAQDDAGEVAGLPGEPPTEALNARITSTADNCLGGQCPDFAECFVVRARRTAAAADLVVVNHALLFADHLIRQEGFAVLPGVDAVVVDEAHQLPELALRHFGSRVSTQQLASLVRDTHAEIGRWNDVPDLSKATEALADATAQLEAGFIGVPARQRTAEFAQRPGMPETLDALAQRLDAVVSALKPLEERTAEFGNALERALRIQERLALAAEWESVDRQIRWVEPMGRGGALNATPLDVAVPFAAMRAAHPGAWIFTSATLAAGRDFGHFTRPLGLDDTTTVQLDSPFDYAAQARFWLPPGLPEPNDGGYVDAVTAAVLPLLVASGGGAFLLCTSHRALVAYAARLREAFGTGPDALPVLAQNDAPKAELLERFAASGRAVLVATASFWEGVDVKGQGLRMVVIDRLPFSAPGDPVLDAKLDAIRDAGGNPFAEDQLPRAIVALRQGAGRLIRDETDRGLLVLCDPRLRSRGYGRKVLASLPPMTQARSLDEVLDWCRAVRPAIPDTMTRAVPEAAVPMP